MIIERDGLTYVPISTFAKAAGVADRKVIVGWVETGLIHHSYCIEIKLEDEFKWKYFIRYDKAKVLRDFLDRYKRWTEFKSEIKLQYGITVSDEERMNMYALGFIQPEWYKAFGMKTTMIFFCIDYIKDFVDSLKNFRQTKGQRNGMACFDFDFSDPPPDAILYKPNENCEGFLLTEEQIERLKKIRAYKENKEPFF